MQALHDIFGIWDQKIPIMAAAIGAKVDTVRKWKRSGRIPEDSWQAVIDAAVLRGHTLTPSDLWTANRAPKLRGRPAHKVRPLRRRRRKEESQQVGS